VRHDVAVRFLWWLTGQLKGLTVLGILWSTLNFAGRVAMPFMIGQAIDRGLGAGSRSALFVWTAAVLVVGVANAGAVVMRHRMLTKLRNEAALRIADRVATHATRLGAALPRRVTTGEVVTIGISDVWTVGAAMNVPGGLVPGLLAYAMVAVLLFRVSALLAVVVLICVPVLAITVGPVLGRMQRAATHYRARRGELNARLVDVLAGLRVLNGLGGKDSHQARYQRESAGLRDLGYRVGRPTSWIGALSDGLPVVLLGVIVWLAARLAARGEITPGELIAVYGYTAVLLVPVRVLVYSSLHGVRGLVAARRITDFLDLPLDDPAGVAAPTTPSTLYDPDSAVTAEPGRFTALAGTGAAEILDRLGRYGPTDATWGGRPVAGVALPEVRSRILVAGNDAHLFAGSLRDVVAGPSDPDDTRIRQAITVAVAHDVATDLDRPIEAGGRNLSGGQRQRVRLARAVHADPEMLLAVEPTSAVDAHTEAAIAERLAAVRDGRGTVVATTSPVLLDRADVVHFLVDGRVAASGTHRDLLADQPGYRALVSRVYGEDS
jgi:ABC-type multidrug transport system fused ATPase/permease subunit